MIHIAVVEDEETCIRQMEDYLIRYQTEFSEELDWVVYRDGDALTREFRAQFDMIFMDIQMKFIDGMSAAEEIRGLQDKGIAVYLKHFVVNDQETNRGGVHTWVDEQALREIYCKPFEIVTKEADCNGYMTSYNYIGTGWTGACKALMTDLARGEWGTMGRFITDAAMDFAIYVPDTGTLAGLDMWLAPMTATTSEKVYGTDYGIRALQESAHRQLYVFANTSGVGSVAAESNTWMYVVGGVNAVLVVLMLLSVIFLIIPGFKGKGGKKNEKTKINA